MMKQKETKNTVTVRIFGSLIRAFANKPEATLAFSHMMFGYGKVSYSPVWMHKGRVPNGVLKGVQAVMLEPLPVTHFTGLHSKAEDARIAKLLTPANVAKHARAYMNLPVVLKSSNDRYSSVNTYRPLKLVEDLTFNGELIGIALDYHDIDEQFYHLSDATYERTEEEINGVTYPAVESDSLRMYADSHIMVDPDSINVEDFVEVPFPGCKKVNA